MLIRWSAGEEACLSELMPLMEGELRRIAHRQLRRERSSNLQTTELVNEAYLKLVDQTHATWQNRAQFLGVAAGLMRRILVDRARSAGRVKRSSAAEHLPIDEALIVSQAKPRAIIALDEALESLAKLDVRKARVVELRFFGGMTVEETAEVLHLHPNSVIRDWSLAKAWLKRELSREGQTRTPNSSDHDACDGDIKGRRSTVKAARIGQFSGGSRPIEARRDWFLLEGWGERPGKCRLETPARSKGFSIGRAVRIPGARRLRERSREPSRFRREGTC